MSPVTLLAVLRSALEQRVRDEGLRPLSAAIEIPVGQIRSVLTGRSVKIDTAVAIAEALGLEFYLGPPHDKRDHGTGAVVPGSLQVASATAAELRRVLEAAQQTGVELAARVAEVARQLDPDKTMGVAQDAARMRPRPFARDMLAAAGHGAPVFDESNELQIAIADDALASWAKPDAIVFIRAVGDSMLPTVRDGDLLAVDSTRLDPLDGQVFVVYTDAGLVVKRLRKGAGNRWRLTSDNGAYEARPITQGDRIVGQVAWTGPPTSKKRSSSR